MNKFEEEINMIRNLTEILGSKTERLERTYGHTKQLDAVIRANARDAMRQFISGRAYKEFTFGKLQFDQETDLKEGIFFSLATSMMAFTEDYESAKDVLIAEGIEKDKAEEYLILCLSDIKMYCDLFSSMLEANRK